MARNRHKITIVEDKQPLHEGDCVFGGGGEFVPFNLLLSDAEYTALMFCIRKWGDGNLALYHFAKHSMYITKWHRSKIHNIGSTRVKVTFQTR